MRISILMLLIAGLLVSCQKSETSGAGKTENVPDVTTENLTWHSAELSDLPNSPVVMIAPNYDSAIVAVKKNNGEQVIKKFKLVNGQVEVLQNESVSAESIAQIEPQEKIKTSFKVLKQRLIQNHEKAISHCRYSRLAAGIKKDTYDSRGAVFLKLKGAWSDNLTGFEVLIALDPITGQFLDFSAVESGMSSHVRGFLSVPHEWVLAGPKGQTVREYNVWNSACRDAYNRTKRNIYKPGETEKRDKDASELVDLENTLGELTNLFYETHEIILEELNKEEK
jgi:hypothetical protein